MIPIKDLDQRIEQIICSRSRFNYNEIKRIDSEKQNSKDEAPKRKSDFNKVNDWLNFSMMPQTEEKIRDHILSKRPDVCISYICRYSTMSSEFLEELIGISFGYFNNDNYSKSAAYQVADIVTRPLPERKKIVNSLYEHHIHQANSNYIYNYKDIPFSVINQMHDDKYKGRTKIDWFYVFGYQNVSDLFKLKYGAFEDKSYCNYILYGMTTNPVSKAEDY